MRDFTSRRAAFRKLHESGCFVIPNPWDAGTARYLRRLGFKALATTSSGFSFSQALPDMDWAVPVDMALGHIYASSGRLADARKIAMDLEEKVRQKQVSPFLPAVVYAGLNEKDRSFYWLERAYQERSNWLTLIKVGRRLKPLHDDPRFDDLLKRIGFEF